MKMYELMTPDYKQAALQKMSFTNPIAAEIEIPVTEEKTYSCLIEQEDIENGIVTIEKEDEKWRAKFTPIFGLEAEDDTAPLAMITLGLNISSFINQREIMFFGILWKLNFDRKFLAEYILALSQPQNQSCLAAEGLMSDA